MFKNSKLCRLCLIEAGMVLPIFTTKDVAETSSIQMKIMELANVQVGNLKKLCCLNTFFLTLYVFNSIFYDSIELAFSPCGLPLSS